MKAIGKRGLEREEPPFAEQVEKSAQSPFVWQVEKKVQKETIAKP